MASLSKLYRGSGAEPPAFPERSAFVERCAALGLDERQLGCLHPDRARSDPAGCRDALAPVRGQVDGLVKWFTDNLQRTP